MPGQLSQVGLGQFKVSSGQGKVKPKSGHV